MTPNELRQAVPVEVEQHMRDGDLWPDSLQFVFSKDPANAKYDGWEVYLGDSYSFNADHAAALIGWAIEGQLIRTHYTAWDKSGGYCVYGVGDPALQVIESHNDRLPALVAAYRRIFMGEPK